MIHLPCVPLFKPDSVLNIKFLELTVVGVALWGHFIETSVAAA